MQNFFQFVQSVSAGGYMWRSGRFHEGFDPEAREGPALVQAGSEVRPIEPSPQLFLDFAALDPKDDNALLNFANANGLLGDRLTLLFQSPPSQPTEGAPGEFRNFWRDRIREMGAAVSLWKSIRSEDEAALAKVIRWRGRERVDYEGPPFETFATIASAKEPEERPFLLNRFAPGDVVMPAKLYLQTLTNEALQQWLSPKLLWARDRKRMGLFIVPNSLLGSMWYHFAAALAEFKTFRDCAGCGTPMLIAPQGTGQRANKTTCSNACRVAVYTSRIAQAQRMAQQGMAPKQIAQALGAKLQSVKTWIKKGRSSGKKARTK